MKPASDIRPLRLPAQATHCIEDGKGLELTAVSGTVWITQAGDMRDVILARGQSFVLDRNGRAVLYALKDATIVVAPAGHIADDADTASAAWDAAA
jgi:hypothetical protein